MKVSKSKLGCVFWQEPREIAAFRSTLRNAQSDLQSFMELLDFDENFSNNNSTNLQKVLEIMTNVQKYLICKTTEVTSDESCLFLEFYFLNSLPFCFI